jgi:hypothetical protein
LVLDDNLDRPLNRINTCRVAPELVKDYDIEVLVANEWKAVVAVQGNRQRLCLHHIEPVTTGALRVCVYASNGAPNARIVEIRVELENIETEVDI